MNILLLDGQHKSTLAITRYLARIPGYKITVAAHKRNSLTFYSKYPSKKILLPDPKNDSDNFSKELIKILSQEAYDVVMPVGYFSTKQCVIHQDEIQKNAGLIVPKYAAFETAGSKTATYKLAGELNIPYPKSIFLETPEDIHRIELRFPLVIKYPFEYGTNLVSYAKNKDELIEKFNKMVTQYPVDGHLPVIQEYIRGDGYGFFALYRNGQCIQSFMHKRIREYPITGGASVCADTFSDPVLREYGQKILDHLHWNGVAMVEFKKDVRDNTYKLMEINPKFWGSLELSLAAGINFPDSLIKSITGDDIIQLNKYPAMRFQWILNGEVFHGIENPKAISSIIKDLFRSKKDFSFRDPLPHIFQLSAIAVHYLKKLNRAR